MREKGRKEREQRKKRGEKNRLKKKRRKKKMPGGLFQPLTKSKQNKN